MVYQLFAYKSFILHLRINRAIIVPTVITTIRTNDDHLQLINFLCKLWCFFYPSCIIATVTMQKIYNRKTFLAFFIILRCNHHTFNILLHTGAEHSNRINFAGEEMKRDKEKKEESG